MEPAQGDNARRAFFSGNKPGSSAGQDRSREGDAVATGVDADGLVRLGRPVKPASAGVRAQAVSSRRKSCWPISTNEPVGTTRSERIRRNVPFDEPRSDRKTWPSLIAMRACDPET